MTTLHGTDTTLLGPNPQYRPAIAHALMHSDAVTAVSQSLRQKTLDVFGLARPVEVIPNFFTPSLPTRTREEIRREFGISDEFLVLHMSNLRPTKRIDLLLRVIAATEQRKKIRLLILAGGRFELGTNLCSIELNIRENVIVRTAAEPVENYINASDAGISTSEVESFGLSILEMMFFAKPVLAFAIDGVPEVIGDAGSLHPFGDITSMAATLDQLIESPSAAASLGQRGEVRAKSEFTAKNVVPMYEKVYSRVLSPER